MHNHFVPAIVLALALAAPIVAADDPVSCKQTDQILAELRELRKLLETRSGVPSQPPPTMAAIDVGNAPFLGSKEAPLTIVEFTDFQCPFCKRFHEETFGELKKNYIDPGKVRYYSMDLPLDMHKNALLAAQAGRCAGEQGQFWGMHDRMQTNPQQLELGNLTGYAGELGIDVTAFRQYVESGKYKEAIQKGASDAASKGARGTPAFVIGKSTPTGVDGELVVGAVPYSLFEKKLKELAH